MKEIDHKDIHSKVGGRIGVKISIDQKVGGKIDEGFIEKEWGD